MITLTALGTGLKLTTTPDLSWTFVLSPLWLPPFLIIPMLTFAFIIIKITCWMLPEEK